MNLVDVLPLHQQLYNAALEQRISVYKSKKISLSYVKQAIELTDLRSEDDRYRNSNFIRLGLSLGYLAYNF